MLGKEVRLAHFSVKEYLLSDRIQSSSASKFGATSMEADHFISESSLLYIIHYNESDSKATSRENLGCFPLFAIRVSILVHSRKINPRRKPKIDRPYYL